MELVNYSDTMEDTLKNPNDDTKRISRSSPTSVEQQQHENQNGKDKKGQETRRLVEGTRIIELTRIVVQEDERRINNKLKVVRITCSSPTSVQQQQQQNQDKEDTSLQGQETRLVEGTEQTIEETKRSIKRTIQETKIVVGEDEKRINNKVKVVRIIFSSDDRQPNKKQELVIMTRSQKKRKNEEQNKQQHYKTKFARVEPTTDENGNGNGNGNGNMCKGKAKAKGRGKSKGIRVPHNKVPKTDGMDTAGCCLPPIPTTCPPTNKKIFQEETASPTRTTRTTRTRSRTTRLDHPEATVKGCVCGSIHPRPIYVFWIQCDGPCKTWYNCSKQCIGFDIRTANETYWYCNTCLEKNTIPPTKKEEATVSSVHYLSHFPTDIWYTILSYLSGSDWGMMTMGTGSRTIVKNKVQVLLLQLAPLCKDMHYTILQDPFSELWSLILQRDYILQAVGGNNENSNTAKRKKRVPSMTQQDTLEEELDSSPTSSPTSVVPSNNKRANNYYPTTTRRSTRPRRCLLFNSNHSNQSIANQQIQHLRSSLILSPREEVKIQYLQLLSRTEDASIELASYCELHQNSSTGPTPRREYHHQPNGSFSSSASDYKSTLTLKRLRQTISTYSPININRRNFGTEKRTLLHIVCAADANEGVILRCIRELIEVYNANPYIFTNGEYPFADCPVIYFAIARVMPSVVQYLIDCFKKNSTSSSRRPKSAGATTRKDNDNDKDNENMTLSSLMNTKVTGYLSYISDRNRSFFGVDLTPYQYACELKRVESESLSEASTNNSSDSNNSTSSPNNRNNNKTKTLPPYWMCKLNVCIKILREATYNDTEA